MPRAPVVGSIGPMEAPVMRRLGRVSAHLAAAAVPEDHDLWPEQLVLKVAGGEVRASSGRVGRLR